MDGKCYPVLQHVENIDNEKDEESRKRTSSPIITVSETFGGALALVGATLYDLEHDEESFRCVDVQVGSGFFAADGKNYILKIVCEVPDKNVKITHSISDTLISM